MLQIKKTNPVNEKDLYLIGASAFLLADLLSDQDNIKVLRGLKEVLPEIKHIGLTSIKASAVYQACHKYTKAIEQGRHIPAGNQKASKEAMQQFLESSQYLERWLNILFEVDQKKHLELDTKIRKAIEEVKGKRKPFDTQLLEWLQSQPEQLSRETIRNKIIQLANK